MRRERVGLEESRLAVLVDGCRYHAAGLVSASATIGCCWDADRLDLPRVGIVPSASLLSTAAALTWSGGYGGPPEWIELTPFASG